jgi:hypothetical protein
VRLTLAISELRQLPLEQATVVGCQGLELPAVGGLWAEHLRREGGIAQVMGQVGDGVERQSLGQRGIVSRPAVLPDEVVIL